MLTTEGHRLDAALRELVIERDGSRCTVARFLGGIVASGSESHGINGVSA